VTFLAAGLAGTVLAGTGLAGTGLAGTGLAGTVLAGSSGSSSTISDVEPGLLGFLVVAALGIALVFLLRSMNKQFRKIGPRPEDPESADAEVAVGTVGPPGPASDSASADEDAAVTGDTGIGDTGIGDTGAGFDPDAQTGAGYGSNAIDVRTIDAKPDESGGKRRRGSF
jgi:hypothetical protein